MRLIGERAYYGFGIRELAADKEDAATRAVKAGLDMEMTPPMQTPSMLTVPEALKTGKLSEAQIDDAVRAVLEAKIKLGLFGRPFVDEAKTEAALNDPAHLKLARVAAERSAPGPDGDQDPGDPRHFLPRLGGRLGAGRERLRRLGRRRLQGGAGRQLEIKDRQMRPLSGGFRRPASGPPRGF